MCLSISLSSSLLSLPSRRLPPDGFVNISIALAFRVVTAGFLLVSVFPMAPLSHSNLRGNRTSPAIFWRAGSIVLHRGRAERSLQNPLPSSSGPQ